MNSEVKDFGMFGFNSSCHRNVQNIIGKAIQSRPINEEQSLAYVVMVSTGNHKR